MSDNIESVLKRLAEVNLSAYPVVSVYLNTQANAQGRDQFASWIRKQLAERARTFEQHSAAAENFQADCQAIETWLRDNLEPASNSVAIFSCHGESGFFEAIQLAVPI